MRVAWVSSWDRVCGIADYSKVLFPEIQSRLPEARLFSLDEFRSPRALLQGLTHWAPDLIHFQHEYGLYGGKNPPRYQFPRVVEALKKTLPQAKLVATGHTVLAPDYEFPTEGRGVEAPVRSLANRYFLPMLRREWGPKTWGQLDSVLVHSALQKAWVEDAGCKRVEEVPHFVPVVRPVDPPARSEAPRVLVFGFFTPEKGQDLVIEAMAKLFKSGFIDPSMRLVLAGGVRRKRDQNYFDLCMKQAKDLGIESLVEVTGFLPMDRIDEAYAGAQVVVAPFRETSGSGSLAHGLARGMPILASDLALNREIVDRVKGSLALFQSGSAEDLALQLKRLLDDSKAQQNLRKAALEYARAYAPSAIAEKTVALYGSF